MLSRVAKLYFSRWRIEEYFRCKKQVFRFEGFRVRKLKAINALNFYITLCMAFLAHLSMKPETNVLLAAEIFLNAPSGKVELCDPDDIFFGRNLLICGQHHGMLRNPIDQHHRMRKRASGSGSGRSVRPTVNSASSWPSE